MPDDLSLLLILEQVKGVDLVPIKTIGHSDVAIVIVTQGLTSTGLPAVGASDTAPNRTWSTTFPSVSGVTTLNKQALPLVLTTFTGVLMSSCFWIC